MVSPQQFTHPVEYPVLLDIKKKVGATGRSIETIQQLLTLHGYSLTTTGVFDSTMVSQVVRFQYDHNLVPDGVVGGKTLWLLQERPPTEGTVTYQDILEKANELNLPPDVWLAVHTTQQRGSGYFDNGQPKLLFNRQIMAALLSEKGVDITPLIKRYRNSISTEYGGFILSAMEWDRFNIAARVDRDLAIQSSYFGMYYTLGMHWKRLGYPDPDAFYHDVMSDEYRQLTIFVALLRSHSTALAKLRQHDWEGFSELFNGSTSAKPSLASQLDYNYHHYTQYFDILT